MKVKRFLLRYDPPGVGLELDDGSTVHKDLAAASDVTDVKTISTLVDELIASERKLLTTNKHRPALIQLLGRLYQITVPDEDVVPTSGEEDAGDKTERRGKRGGADEPPDLQEGQQVVLIQLKGNLQVHNGETGILVKVKREKKKFKFEVRLDHSGEQIEVQSRDPELKGRDIALPTLKGARLEPGTHVAIRGLRNHVDLNGCLGRVVECQQENHRYEVRALESGQLFRVKQENLVCIDPAGLPVSVIMPAGHASKSDGGAKDKSGGAKHTTPRSRKDGLGGNAAGAGGPPEMASAASLAPVGGADDEMLAAGSQVQLVNLKTAMVYNGQNAEVLSTDRARARYEIRLGDGSIKTVRAENVRLVAGLSRP